MPARYLALEVPDDRLLYSIAEEAAITDGDLDALEERLRDPARSPQELAAAALLIGRAGRAESRAELERAALRLTRQGASLEAQVVELAVELLEHQPGRGVERAELGYRRRGPGAGDELYVEDPLAAHWHRRDRWGPPLRVDRRQAQRLARGPGEVQALHAALREGAIAVVCFAPEGWRRRVQAPLRLTRAGLSRDASLRALVRWSHVRSVGTAERGGVERAAFEVHGQAVEILPARPSIPTADLVALMTRLLEDAHR